MTGRALMVAIVSSCVLFVNTAATVTAAEPGKVSGVITVKGMPLESGKITFYQENGQFAGSKIKGGKFTVDWLVRGEMTVVVEGKGVPAKFTSEETSALKAMVVEGKNVFQFDLQ